MSANKKLKIEILKTNNNKKADGARCLRISQDCLRISEKFLGRSKTLVRYSKKCPRNAQRCVEVIRKL